METERRDSWTGQCAVFFKQTAQAQSNSTPNNPTVFVLPGAQLSSICAQLSSICAPGSTIKQYLCSVKQYLCSREHNYCLIVLPGAQILLDCAVFDLWRIEGEGIGGK
jgi:hypothetical protein